VALRYYGYVIVSLTVRRDKSLAALLARLAPLERVEVLNYDEETRRVLVRATISEASFVGVLAREFSTFSTIEVKYFIKGRKPDYSALEQLGARCSRVGRKTLFVFSCNNGLLYGEVGKRIAVKYCKRALIVDPSAVPPSICMFQADSGEAPKLIERLVSESRTCVEEFTALLRSEGEEGGNKRL
jgi:hypothetical protein